MTTGKTPGAMFLVPRELIDKAMLACFEAGFGIPHGELRAILAEQTPAVGGEPVSGVELEIFEPHGWAQTEGPAINAFTQEFDIAEEWAMAGHGTVELLNREHVDAEIERLQKAHSERVAPLLAENKRLDLMVAQSDHNYDADRAVWAREKSELVARIAELEAAQGEAVAVVDEADDGMFIEFIYGENGSPLRRGDKLYRQAQPATAKVVLPERSSERDHAGDFTYEAKAWNACLDEIAKLNSISASASDHAKYNLLKNGEVIAADDEYLNDTSFEWCPVQDGVFVGMPYSKSGMLPVRRADHRKP